MKQYLRFILSLFLTITSCQPAFTQTKVDGSLLKGDVIGGTASNTRRIVVPKDTKSNLDAKTRLEANLVYGTDTKKAYIDNGTSLVAVGSGSGGAVNLITDGDAENATSSIFVPYKDAAASRPVDGVGSSADVTTAVTSTAPLTGAKSFTITKDAVNRQGQGWSIPFTVPLSMQAKVLQIEVDYIVNSGTFVAGSSSADSDVIWYLYDITNSTLIEPSSIKLLSNSATLADKFRSTFQTSATGTSYRLIAHVASTSASAYELKVEASVSPSVYVYGTPITDWQSYTLTIGSTGTVPTKGTVSIDAARYRRIGDSLEIRYQYKQTSAGASGTGNYLFPIPPGFSIDTSKVVASTSDNTVPAVGHLSVQATTDGLGVGAIQAYDSTRLWAYAITSTASLQVGATNFNLGQASVLYSFTAIVPILGWSSSVQMSDSADTKIVQAKYRFTSSKTSGPTAPLNFDTIVSDSGNVTTGVAWKFTAHTSGKYVVQVAHNASGASVTTQLFKNGSVVDNFFTSPFTAGNGQLNGSCQIDLIAGDYIDIRFDSSTSSNGGYVNIFKLSGPSAIAASESINLSYSSNTTGSIGTSATLQSFATKAYDTHGAWSGSVFTAPIAGKYQIASNILTASVTLSTVQELVLLVYKNGSSYRRLDTTLGNGSGVSYSAQGITTVDLLAGETLSIYASSAVATTQQGSGTFTFVTIEKVGN